MAKGQRPRSAIRDIAVALSMLHAEIKTAGSIGIKQNQLVSKLVDATGVSQGVFYRELNRLIEKGDVVNQGGFKKYRHLVWKDNYPRTGRIEQPASIPAFEEKVAAEMPPAITNLDITIYKEPPGISFLLNNVRVTINIP